MGVVFSGTDNAGDSIASHTHTTTSPHHGASTESGAAASAASPVSGDSARAHDGGAHAAVITDSTGSQSAGAAGVADSEGGGGGGGGSEQSDLVAPALVAKPETMRRWAVRVSGWTPTREQWLRAAASVAPEERERIGRFMFATDAKLAMAGKFGVLSIR